MSSCNTFSAFSVFSICAENTRKVSKCPWRIRGKYLSVIVHGEDGEFMLVCGIQNRIRIHREYVNLLGEYAKNIYTHMENTSKDSTLTGMSK